MLDTPKPISSCRYIRHNIQEKLFYDTVGAPMAISLTIRVTNLFLSQ